MKSVWIIRVFVVVLTAAGATVAFADDLTIFDIQSNTSDGDASAYSGQIHNVSGGVVTHVWSGFNKRVYLHDPAFPTWGAVVIKDGEGGELADNVGIGDWVSFTDILVDEFGGTTLLQYRRSQAPDVSFTVESSGNAVPGPTLVPAIELRVDPTDHTRTEPYESMVVALQNVIVGQMDLGRVGDNYELLQGNDIAWATDYMNIDAGAPYDPRIIPGAELERITGIVEQNAFSGWDYYQLNTRSAADIVPEPGVLTLLVVGMICARRRLR